MKVKLPADVAHALGQLQKTHSNRAIMRSLGVNDAKKIVRTIQSYINENGDENFNNIMRALLDGYEKE
jgi:lysophospholipase L1-like esterase